MASNKPKVLVIGWDGADWKVASPLMDAGKMPHLKRLVDGGVMGNIATLYPVLSPVLWTSIATGKRAHKHGIYGFVEPDPSTGAVRPITNLGRKCKTLWNIFNQNDLRSNVVGWWPSHPAEPINGVMVSNHFQKSTAGADKPWPLRHGTIHPQRLMRQLAKFRVHPGEIEADAILPFVPSAASVDQEKDGRLAAIANILAETASVQAVATAILQHEPCDFMAVYFDAIDHFCHGFMKFHPPRESWVDEGDFEIYKEVVNTAYQFHDVMLGAMLSMIDDDTTVVIVSDHGFHPDHLRPRMIGNEPAGPADEHRRFGMFVMHGPNIKQDELVFGASLLDVAPTILHLYGLPIGRDMDGRVLVDALEDPGRVDLIDSWEDVPGDDGGHPDDVVIDTIDDHASLQQLVELGYIEKLDEDKETAALNAKRELRYNLARDYLDVRKFPQAIAELQSLWDECPEESRFGVKLFTCYIGLNDAVRAELVLTKLLEEKQRYAAVARKELDEIKQQRQESGPLEQIPELSGDREALENQKEEAQRLRRLMRLSQVNTAALAFFRGCLLQIKGDYRGAIAAFQNAANVQTYNQPSLKQKLGECYLALEEHGEALKQYRAILDIDPISADAHLGLAQTELAQAKPRRAYQAASSALGLVYHNPRAHYIAGRALSSLGQFAKALEHLNTAISQNPLFPDCFRFLATLHTTLGDKTTAQRFRNEAEQALAKIKQVRSTQTKAIDSGDACLLSDEAFGIGEITNLNDNGDSVVVVSGLPRSGTSMMMQMLQAGGIAALTDDRRGADENNPRGYFEFEPVRKLASHNRWFDEARGKAVKVIAQLLPHIPSRCNSRVIFMARPMSEIISSQTKMLERLGSDDTEQNASQLAATYAKQVQKLSQTMTRRKKIAAITVNYNEVVENPRTIAQRVNEFLGGKLDEAAMVAAVDKSLHREKTAS